MKKISSSSSVCGWCLTFLLLGVITVDSEQSTIDASSITGSADHELDRVERSGNDNNRNNNNHHHSLRRKLNEFCNLGCFSNDNCQAATDGCNFCNGFECYNPNKCGIPCQSHNDCAMTRDTCQFCDGFTQVCTDVAPDGNHDRTCISTNGSFQAALNNASIDVIEICENTQFVLGGKGDAFTANRDGFSIVCQNTGSNCGIIRKGGSGRLLNINGGSINIARLIFDHGNAGDGAALYISGGNNNLEDCTFRDNTSTGNGGAVNWNNGNVVRCSGFNNYATNGGCDGIYSRSTQTCNNSVNSNQYNTIDQCAAYCDSDLSCDRVNGVCGICNSNSICVQTIDGGDNRDDVSGPCVSTESSLRAALTSQSIVEVCQNVIVDITTGTLETTLENQTLRCQNSANACTLRRPDSSSEFRLLHATGNGFTLEFITFQNGNALDGDGGGVLLEGETNTLTSVSFIGNRASERGGAAAIQSGTVFECTYDGNFAPQCVHTFIKSSGSCQI